MHFPIWSIAALLAPAALAATLLTPPTNDTSLVLNTDTTSNLQIAQHLATAHEPALHALIALVMAIPDDVLQRGDEATHDWIAEYTRHHPTATVPMYDRGFFSCAASIASALLSAAIPVAKLLQLRRVVTAAGGVLNFVRALTTGDGFAAVEGILQGIAAVSGFGDILIDCTPS